MDVAKVIRILGYIVYTALWSPVIVIALVVAPIMYGVLGYKFGKFAGVKEWLKLWWVAQVNNIKHDMYFIKTGVWY